MTKLRLTIALLLLAGMPLTSMTCRREKESETCHRSVYFWNNSNKAIYYSIEVDYPDTTLSDLSYNPVHAPQHYKVLSGNRSKETITRSCIENYFTSLPRPEKIMIYVFDADMLESTPWETVKQQYMVLKRYDLSLHDLDDLGWQVSHD